MPSFAHLPVQIGAILVASVMLWKGADWMVDAVARVARRMHISELVIGLTFVAFGTSAPELAVSVGAAIAKQPDISVGNIVGSNIFNLGIILGSCAAIRPIMTSRMLVYRDGIFLIAVTLVLAAFMSDGEISRFEGIVMVSLLATYLGLLVWRRQPFEPEHTPQEKGVVEGTEKGSWHDIPIAIGGLVLVLLGSKLLVLGASGLARHLGLSNWVIAVTIVAGGTSAPELVTSLTAVLKGHHGISAGGLVGSDLYNVMGVLGTAAIIRPLSVSAEARVSVYVLVAMVMLVVLFMRTGWRLSRLEGLTLLVFNLARWWLDIVHRPLG